ncbi:DsbA family protein, partial [Aquisalimonas lutea]|uniref:DsbA family protein n=1 Tax=Aquisalimonas lutea TaxID=1327750 RepID=UPI0025B444B2
MARLEWFFDVICPQVAVAAARLGTLARETGHELVLRPVSLARMYERQRLPSQPEQAWPASKRELHHRDTHRQAEDAGVHLRGPLDRPVTESTAAQQLLAGAPDPARPGLLHGLLSATWERGKPLDDEGLLRRLADDHGVDPGVITATESRAALERTTDEALDRGAFGVPTFMLDDRLWWGADRLAFVAGALGGAA